ncbi:MAG TPA: TolC family protein [Gemmatimonadaceae bacterium]|nr:TolC family protein [Gemmatimonadaceae bacterium]
MIDRWTWYRVTLALSVVLAAGAPALLAAQGVAQEPEGRGHRLSLDDALRMAERVSEPVAMARAGVLRSRGQQSVARSQFLPQIYGSAQYTRTLKTQYASLSTSSSDTSTAPPPPNCSAFVDNPAWTPQMRRDSINAAVNRALLCPAANGGNPFTGIRNLPFGQANAYQLGLTVTQNVFAGGRIDAQIHEANAARQTAEVNLASARAQLVISVASAYYDAVLSDQLVAIADSTLAQDDRTLSQTRLAEQVGNAPQFDLLTAQVTRNNQLPVVIQQRANRSMAYLQLKQLLQMPLDDSLELTSDLSDTSFVPGTTLAALVSSTPDTATAERAPVRAARSTVQSQQSAVTVARAQYIPTLTLSSSYGRVAYPRTGLPSWGDFLSNWTVSAGLQIPIFTGGQIHGNVLTAKADLQQAQAQLRQTQELAALDTRNAIALLQAAQASWQAVSGTVHQAVQAYQIAEVRYREGVSTQTELAGSRLLLQQARANRAQAARDLQVARLRLALIHDLPLGGTNGQPATTTAAPGTSPATLQLTVPLTPQLPGQTSPPGAPGGTVAARRTGGTP